MLGHAIFVTRLMQSLARVCQNRASEAKRALVVAGVNTKLYSHEVKLKSSIQENATITPPVNLDLKSFP